jgi:uncharacterized protein (TIGR03085 family)
VGGRVSIRGRGRLPSPSYHPGVTNYSRSERIALADLLEELGPDAPTLCEGWTTADLAAHLVVRERRPDAGLGIVASPLARWTANVQASAKKRYDYQQLTQLVRQGPPLWSPLRPVDALANTVEYFVHHEDVRCATPDWRPRALDPGLEDTLTRRLGFAKTLLRKAPVGVVLRLPDGSEPVSTAGEPVVTITGTGPELLLCAFGRQSTADVDYAGPDDAVAAFRAAKLGI